MRLLPLRKMVVFAGATQHLRAKVPQDQDDLDWEPLTPDIVDELYRGDEAFVHGFKRFASRGYVGVVVHRGGQWLSHIWAATPETAAPPHLPVTLTGRNWLFGGHTSAKHRNHGYLKVAILRMVDHLSNSQTCGVPTIYGDVLVDNLASRRSLSTMGFAPNGMMWTIHVPKTALVWGHWDLDRAHPDYLESRGLSS